MLAILDEDQAKILIVRNGFGEGLQAHFLYHWKNWKSLPTTQNNQSPQTTAIIESSKTFVPEHQATEINTPTIEQKIDPKNDDDAITMTKIFDWAGKISKTIIASYHKNDILSELERSNLCDIIINYCLVNDFKLNVGICRMLAEEIVAAFPNEIETAYHKVTNGRLITKYNYKQRHNKAKDNKVTEKRPASPSTSSKKKRTDNGDEEMLKAISKLNNNPSLTADEIKVLWRATAQNRIDFIAEAPNSMAVYAKWKQYTEPLGHVYVCICSFILISLLISLYFNFASTRIPFSI